MHKVARNALLLLLLQMSALVCGQIINPGSSSGGSGTVSSCAGPGNAYYAGSGTTTSCDTNLTDNGAGALTSAQPAITVSTPWLNHTGTWNAGAVVFTGRITNLTCTAAAAASNFFDWQLASVSVFRLQFAGANCATPYLQIPAGTATQAGLVFVGDTTSGIGRTGSNSFGFTNGTKFFFLATTNKMAVANGSCYAISNNVSDATATPIVALCSQGVAASAQLILSSSISGDSATPPASALIRAPATIGGTSNVSGSDWIEGAGVGTGNSTPSRAIQQAPAIGQASGTTQQPNVNRHVINDSKTLSTTNTTATNLMSLNIAASAQATTIIRYTVVAKSATDTCVSSGLLIVVAEASSTAVQKSAVNAATGLGGTSVCTGTDTLTLSFAVTAANPAVVSVTPTWATIVPTSVYATYNFDDLSDATTTL